MSLLLLLQNMSSWTIYYRLLELHLSQLLIVTSWWNLLLDMFIVSLVSHSTSTSLLVPLFYSFFFDTNYNYLCIFLYLLSLLAISNSSLPTPLSSIFLYVLLPVYYSITRLSPLLIPYPLVYKLSLSLISTLFLSAICPLLIL